MYKIRGVVKYNPIRKGIKSKSNICVIDVDSDELCEYYQWHVMKQYGVRLHSPMFGTHTTIIKPEESNIHHPMWGKHEGKEIEIEYGFVERHWGFWSLNVYSDEVIAIRKEMGLNLYYRLHMTIGKQDEWEDNKIMLGVCHDSDFVDKIAYSKK